MSIYITNYDLMDIYDALEFYIKLRYMDYGIDELRVIRHILKNIEKEYLENGDSSSTLSSARKRNAGRKPVYSNENAELILRLRHSGMSIRKIAEHACCSAGRVVSVINRNKAENNTLKKDDRFWDIIDNISRAEEQDGKAQGGTR